MNPTQQFALASVYPRSIAWLVKQDDWNMFEEIVNYNCAMLGGYFNIIIPVSSEGNISEKYINLLKNYDPDFIIMAPGMTLLSFSHSIHPFRIVPWHLVSQIATYDPWGLGSGLNQTLRGVAHDFSKDSVIAVADDKYPDTSRLAFVACGDVKSNASNDPLSKFIQKCFSTSIRGYREQILEKFLKSNCDLKNLACRTKNGAFIQSPDRYTLKDMIVEENLFPLSGAVEILHTCCRMQRLFDSQLWSFIGSTAGYAKGIARHRLPFNMVIFVSDKFSQEEAVLFWNLRAQEVYVAWLSFSELEKDKDSVEGWLGDIFGGALYVDRANFIPAKINLAFSSPDFNIDRLINIFDSLKNAARKYSVWKIVHYDPRLDRIEL